MTVGSDGPKPPALVAAFQQISAAIDDVGEENSARLLAKLALLLSHEVDDAARISSCVERAKAGM